jgi:hypothetical protein
MVNGYRGEVAFRIGGQDHVLWFGWPGIALLQQELGADFDVKIGQAISAPDLPVLAKVLAIGLRESWPGVSVHQITLASPPIATVTDAITVAIKRSFHGMGEVPAEPDKNPPNGRLRKALAKILFWKA